MGKKSISFIVFAIMALITALTLGNQIIETNEKGYYQIKQAAVSGKMTARMKPGMYFQMFGDITQWPKSATMFFTSDEEEGRGSNPISVRFVDGSSTDISGTMRVILPTSDKQAISLTVDKSYQNYEDLEARLLLPVVRKALINSANMMTARESYAERRNDFFILTRDQIDNGPYITETIEKEVIDPNDSSGKSTIRVKIKQAKIDADGNKLREPNPLEGTGITILQFEVKNFDYPDVVDKQIAEQQVNLMAIATAKAKALSAVQQAITKEQEGKANVMKAKYEEEVKKIRAVVGAERDKEVAELAAIKELEVAKLAKATAIEIKEQQILLGQGESKRKQLVMQADGALEKKLSAWVAVNAKYAEEFGKQKWVPEINMSGAGSSSGLTKPGNEAINLINILTAKTLQDLGLDMKIKSNTTPIK